MHELLVALGHQVHRCIVALGFKGGRAPDWSLLACLVDSCYSVPVPHKDLPNISRTIFQYQIRAARGEQRRGDLRTRELRFGFVRAICGLCIPQVSSLQQSQHVLYGRCRTVRTRLLHLSQWST